MMYLTFYQYQDQLIAARTAHSVCCYLLSSHRITLRHMARGMQCVIERGANSSNEKGLTSKVVTSSILHKNGDAALTNITLLFYLWTLVGT